jgi:hypothetical protein
MGKDNTNHCDYFKGVEDIYVDTINIITTNYDTNDPKELLDSLLKKYDEGTRRESEDAERHIAFLCWLIYKAFMHVRLIVGLDFLPKEYSMASGTNAPRLISLQDKKITWTYFRKYPEYFECNIDIEVLWIINFYKELHQYFITCMEEQIQNQKAKVRKANIQLENLYSTIRLANQQREWFEDGYTKYLKAQNKNG